MVTRHHAVQHTGDRACTVRTVKCTASVCAAGTHLRVLRQQCSQSLPAATGIEGQ